MKKIKESKVVVSHEKISSKTKADSKVLETEIIGEGNRHYFIDLCLAVNNKEYLRLVRSDRVVGEDGKVIYKREVIRVFEEHIAPLIEAMSAVFGRYNSSLQ